MTMRLGIMQPYFFPYLGYFALLDKADFWIVFDTAQYIRHGWVNRNRILHPAGGWQYIIVPLKKHSRETPIQRIEVQPYELWKPKLLGQLQHYMKTAPGYSIARNLVEECLSAEEINLSRLNVVTLRKTCELLGIRFDYQNLSEMELNLGPISGPGDWALRIAEAMQATEYINPSGGEELFDAAAFSASGVKLIIEKPFHFSYNCRGYTFEPSLSVIDVLMWNTPEAIRACLDAVKS